MRILHISSAKTFGGGEKHLVDLCRGLHQAGHEVYLALRPTNDWQNRFDFLPPGRIIHVTLRNSFGMFSAKRIARFMRRNDIPLIHAHLARDYIPAGIAARLANDAAFVLTRHVLFGLKPFYRFVLRNLSMAIGVSHAVERQLCELFPREKVCVIQNAIDVRSRATVDRKSAGAEFRRSYELPPSDPLIGIIGELTDNKGQKDFLLSAEIISSVHPDARYIIVGRDNSLGSANRRELRRLVEVLGLADRVMFLDWVEDTAPLFAAMDVMVSASYSESFGLAMLEAMAGATPVVATRTQGAEELIEDGKTGILVRVGDPAASAEAVNSILGHSGAARSLGEAAQRSVLSRFSMDEMIGKTVEVYRKVLGE